MSSVGSLIGGFIADKTSNPPPSAITSNEVSGFQTGAFTGQTNIQSGGNVFTSLERTRAVEEGFSPEQRNIFDEFGNLRSQLEPGFGKLTQAISELFGAAKAKALGDVTAQLTRRRISGSSFGESLKGSIAAEFSRVESLEIAKAGLQEISANIEILDKQNAQLQSQVTADFQELGISANISANVLGLITQQRNIDRDLAVAASTARAEQFGDIGAGLGAGASIFGGQLLGGAGIGQAASAALLAPSKLATAAAGAKAAQTGS